MTGEDAEVICGEFETGEFTFGESGEAWNIILEIKSISVHPDYDITRGEKNSQYVKADIAIIKVNEDLKDQEILRLTPACLPKPHNSKYGIHAGWSSPPPLKFIQETLPYHEEFYRDFFKMWHYKMSLTECQDPTQYLSESSAGVWQSSKLTYNTNSFYPPGTICAREKNFQFCPTSGESGSPLMVEGDDGRFSVVGVNSFTKGCSLIKWDTAELSYLSSWSDASFRFSVLQQFSANPNVYARLSCFLPWIAEQYRMSYTTTEEDVRCQEGTGDINEVGGDQCRTTPTWRWDIGDQTEALCIFPFYLDGKEYKQCTLTEIEDFSRPQFICPIRTLKGKGNKYRSQDVTSNYCPTNAENSDEGNHLPDIHKYTFTGEGEKINSFNGEWELDPDNAACDPDYLGRPVFATCKNTCPGGEAF